MLIAIHTAVDGNFQHSAVSAHGLDVTIKLVDSVYACDYAYTCMHVESN